MYYSLRPYQTMPTEERDIALGQYMSVWNYLETQLLSIFTLLVGAKFEIAYTIFKTGFQTPTLIELFKALGELRLTESEQHDLYILCRRYSRAATKRNRIVHGNWIPENIKDNIAHWVRIYSPISPAKQKETYDKFNQNNYRFTIKQILSSCEDIKLLTADMMHFSGTVMNRLYPGDGLPPELFG